MALPSSYNYVTTRDTIIARALRIIGAIGQGETPSATAVTEAAIALNEMIKEWQADGMQLWRYTSTTAITYTAATATYTIGIGATVNQVAPLKVLSAFSRNITTLQDTPINLITKDEYRLLSSKAAPGLPNQLMYTPPGATASEMSGVITVYPVPAAADALAYQLFLYGNFPLSDLDSSTDNPDFPSYFYNSMSWGLADQLSYEYGVPFAQQAMITKKAEYHKDKALSFDVEEGSLYLQPDWQGRNW